MTGLLSKGQRPDPDLLRRGDEQPAEHGVPDGADEEGLAPGRARRMRPARRRRSGLAGWGEWLGGRRGGVGGFTTSAATRLFFVLILGAVVAGPAALLVELRRPPVAPVMAVAPPATAAVAPASRAASTATQLVRVWLSAGAQDRGRVAALVLVPPQTLQLPVVRPAPPTWVEVAEVQQAAVGEWRVLVQAGGGLAGRAATYLVLVQVSDTSAAAVAIPARITAATPSARDAPHLRTVRLSDLAAEAISGFTTSLLTGDTELSRWTSPDSTLQPGPKACQTVAVTQLLSTTPDPEPVDGTELTVLATLTCTITKATTSRPSVGQSLQYPLVLRARDGRWEVLRYADTTNPSPATSPGVSQLTPVPTSPPTER